MTDYPITDDPVTEVEVVVATLVGALLARASVGPALTDTERRAIHDACLAVPNLAEAFRMDQVVSGGVA